ncbi:MAG: CxxxxCH/CxxCH domain-containing protein, partial [Deltaproteobacteria bacterium]|nr:CxxxxCH/CxxCH domain-containing protein [Deltaproteobacteria bacterium]
MALLAVAACAKSRPTEGRPGGPVTVPAGGPGGGTVTVNPSSCTACHGDPARLAGAATNPLIASAPPRGLLGEQTGRPVGAHDAHLRDGAFSRALACANCHLMPGSISTHQPQALQGKVTFTNVLPNADAAWLGLSTGAPAWDGATCSSTYCHGNFPGGSAVALSWLTGAVQCGSCHGTPPTVIRNGGTHTAATNCEGCHGTGYTATAIAGAALATHVDGNVTLAGSGACDSCHGQPPSGPTTLPGSAGSTHPPRSDCGSCHPGATGPGPGQVAGPGHQDGTVNLVTLSCTTCHGTAARPDAGGAGTPDPLQEAAPPVDVTGAPVGGAHLAHVNPGASGQVYGPIHCTECHLGAVTITGPPLHADGAVTVAFGPVATNNGATPSYTGTSPNCNATYCHGGTLPAGYGGTVATWTWSGAAVTCASCHALPPASSAHTGITAAATACSPCHGGTVNVDGTINVTGGLHINGSLDVTGNVCTACHGDNTAAPRTNFSTAAPPRDHLGNVAVTFRGVGAHATHLRSDGRSAAVACTTCHPTPGSGATHNDGTANVTLAAFGAVPVAGSYSGAALTCSSTWCHGNFAGGNGTGATPAWNTGTGTPLACNACHGAPPPLNATVKHPQTGATDCGLCHAGYGLAAVVQATHVDGTVQAPGGCTACHGDTTVAGAANTNPAVAPGFVDAAIDTHGNPGTAVAQRGVGAHRLHLTTTLSTSITCAQCHGTLPAAGNTSHADGGNPALAWGSVATAGTPASTPSAVQAASVTCSSNWCHGGNAQLQGGTLTSNIPWNAASLPAATCTSCHGNPPPLSASSHHPQNDACATCHGAGYAKSGAATGTVVAATHVNGAIQSATGCTACHGVLSGNGGAPVANTSATAAPGFNGSAVDTRGNAAGPAAGAHAAHLVAGTLRGPVACAECHAVPAAGDTAHATGA